LNLDKLTEELIAIESVTGEENKILDFIEQYLHSSEFTGELIRNKGGIIAHHPSEGSKIAFVGHVDTVPIDLNQLQINDSNKIYGRGSVDMKSGIAVMLEVLAKNYQNVVAVFYTAEEGPMVNNGLEVLMPILKKDFKIDFAVILEPTNGEVQLGCLGSVNADLQINGKSSHSARPWMGENPILKLSEVINFIQNNEIEEHIIDGLTYKQIITVTTISGGSANNVIPSHINLNINFRFLPTQNEVEATKFITDTFSKYGDITIKNTSNGALPNLQSQNVKDFINITGAEVTSKQAWTDIARFSYENIPAVNYGPGDPLLAHSPDEFVNTSQIVESYESIVKYLEG
jgi:succinyl-diaminopimelate desuccinylase|tara:strand:+ start:7096 stop:8130 length:1035 start_codon:yes stop_codon:yes gene_type:complete